MSNCAHPGRIKPIFCVNAIFYQYQQRITLKTNNIADTENEPEDNS